MLPISSQVSTCSLGLFESSADDGDAAMFMHPSTSVQVRDGTPTLGFPFPSENVAWPLLDPRRDSGKWILGLFEGGSSANGVKVNAVSAWTTPKDVVAALSKESGQDVVFSAVPPDVFKDIMIKSQGELAGKELAEMFQFIGEYNYFGKAEEKNHSEHAKWLLPDADLISYEDWLKSAGPWKFE